MFFEVGRRLCSITAMFVDALIKHLPDLTVLENFMKNNVFYLREDPRLEDIRKKARADKKERVKSKVKEKASSTTSTAYKSATGS